MIKTRLFATALLAGIVTSSRAYDLQFDSAGRTVDGFGDWNNSWNWGFAGLLGIPDFEDNATIDINQRVLIKSGFTAQAKNLYLNGGMTLKILGNLSMSSTGLQYVGYSSSATVDHVRGTNNASQGNLVIAFQAGSTGNYNLSNPDARTTDAKLQPIFESVGDQGTANFLHDSGAEHSVQKRLTLGSSSGGSGTYHFYSGKLNVGTDEIIGKGGTGQFHQTESIVYSGDPATTHTVGGSLILGHDALASGIFSLEGGTLTAANEIIGLNGNATFAQGGSAEYIFGTTTPIYKVSNTVTNTLSVAAGTNSLSSYSLGESILTAGYEVIGGGSGSNGTFTQNSGINTVEQDLTLGESAGSTGTYRLNAAAPGGAPAPKLTAHVETIGWDGVGSFIQSGGSNQVSNVMTLGHNTGSAGIYSLSGGTLTSPAAFIGLFGSGLFSQTGGTHTTGTMYFAVAGGTSGTYTLGAGAKLNTHSIVAGSGTSTLNLNSTELKFTKPAVATIIDVGTFNIGSTAGTQGSLVHSSGTQQVKAGTLNVGDSGNGTFNQWGSTGSTIGRLFVANRTGSVGSCNLSNGQISVTQETMVGVAGQGAMQQSSGIHSTPLLILGEASSGTGTYRLSSTGSLQATTETIGASGAGHFFQTGGTHQVSSTLHLGEYAGGVGTYDLSNGALTVNTGKIGGPGTGTFTQTGGTHSVGSLSIANGSQYLLNDGSLIATTLSGGARLEFTGGLLSAGEITGPLSNGGGILSPGNSAGNTHITGDYTQSASGKMHIELGGTSAASFDTVNVDATATLSGTLEVVLIDGFLPTVGNRFNILSATTLIGSFTHLQLPALAPELVWQVESLLNPSGPDTLGLVVAVATGLLDFSTDSGNIAQGDSTTLSVHVASDVTSISIDNGIGAITPVNGIALVPVSPDVTTTYTVTTTRPAGLQTRSLTIIVRPGPVISAASIVGTSFRIEFTGMPDTTYRVRGGVDLMALFLDKGTVTTDPAGAGVATVPMIPGQSRCFYRIEELPAP
ncbi:MAG: DUF4623 domain-containing protein [Akkermansiaceae bacterium]|nr:DUF4623 domain-containing protein [Akkermansiaceae bacterium]